MVSSIVPTLGAGCQTSVFRQLRIEKFSFHIALWKSHTVKQELNGLGKERVKTRNAHGLEEQKSFRFFQLQWHSNVAYHCKQKNIFGQKSRMMTFLLLNTSSHKDKNVSQSITVTA